MASKTDIANMALAHIGVSKSISNVDTDDTTESRAILNFYDVALEDTLGEIDWSFARTFETLSLVEEDPTVEWGYSYSYPNDAVSIRKIYSGVRNDTRDSRVPYEVYTSASGKLIYTDQESAKARYTKSITNTNLFTASFTLAFSFKLAFYCVPSLSGGDPFKIKRDMLEAYMMHISNAEAKSLNEEQKEKDPENSFLQARE